MEKFNDERIRLSRVVFKSLISFCSYYAINCCKSCESNTCIRFNKDSLHSISQDLAIKLVQLQIYRPNNINGWNEKHLYSSKLTTQLFCKYRFTITHCTKKLIIQDLIDHQKKECSEKIVKFQKCNFESEKSIFYSHNVRKLHYFNYLNNLNLHNIYKQFNYFIRSENWDSEFHNIPKEFGDTSKIANVILQETTLNILFNLHLKEKFFL
jgi:hypothetical protein